MYVCPCETVCVQSPQRLRAGITQDFESYVRAGNRTWVSKASEDFWPLNHLSSSKQTKFSEMIRPKVTT